jgi:hypothetical protein
MFPYEVKFEYGVTKKAVRRALLKEAHDPKEGGWQHMCEVAVTEFDIWIGSLSPESHEDFWRHCRLYDRNEGDRLGIQFRGGRSLDGDVSDEERRARMFEIIKQVGEALDLPFEKDVTVLEDGKFKRHKEL